MTDLFPGAKYVQLVEWGYPLGSQRPVPPPTKAFSVIHITGNSSLPSAENEAAYRKNNTGLQNSATFFVNRDGTVVQCLGDPLRMDPWTNGDIRSPDLSNPRIKAVVTDGVNANERSLLTIENVGYEPGHSITAAQEATCAKIIAYYHPKAALPITRQTVIGHYQINSETRKNCPGVNKALLDRIVALATGYTTDMTITVTKYPALRKNAVKAGTLTGYRPSPAPTTKTQTWEAPSGFSSDAEATFSPLPAGWPAGPYQRVIDGAYAGYYLNNAQVTLGKLPTAGFTQADLDKARAEGSAAMDARWEQWNTTAQAAKP